MSDDVAIKARLKKVWGGVASGWEKWWPTIDAAAQPVSDRLCELAHVSAGTWVLDLATGIGEPALTAARLVGPTGKVTAVDQAPEMVAIAERRAREAGMPWVGTHVMDMDALGVWPEKSYDAALSRWGLMFMPHVAGTLRTIHRLLVPDGWMAAATWAAPERVPFCTFAGNAIRDTLGWPMPDGPNAFSLSDPETLARLFAGAGFRDVQGERLTVIYEFPDVPTVSAYIRDVSPLGADVGKEPPERQAEAWAAVEKAAAEFTDGSGRVAIPGECLLVAGRR